jgi:hypothetical protein
VRSAVERPLALLGDRLPPVALGPHPGQLGFGHGLGESARRRPNRSAGTMPTSALVMESVGGRVVVARASLVRAGRQVGAAGCSIGSSNAAIVRLSPGKGTRVRSGGDGGGER